MWCPEPSLDAELAGMLQRPQPSFGCRSERKCSLLCELLNKSNQSSDFAHTPESPHEIPESTGYGSAHNISADLSDQPCPAFLVLWTRATFSCRACKKTIPTHQTKPRACACWLEVGNGPPQAFDKRAYGGCCCWHVHFMHLTTALNMFICKPPYRPLWGAHHGQSNPTLTGFQDATSRS